MFTIGDIKLGTFDCSFKNNVAISFQGGLEVAGGRRGQSGSVGHGLTLLTNWSADKDASPNTSDDSGYDVWVRSRNCQNERERKPSP